MKTLSLPIDQGRALLRAFTWAIYNQDYENLLRAAYGEGLHPSYLEEKRQSLYRSPLRWFSSLDAENQEAFLSWVDAVYGKAALESIRRSAACVICGGKVDGHGHNAEPIAVGRCCSDCNSAKVIPARIGGLGAPLTLSDTNCNQGDK